MTTEPCRNHPVERSIYGFWQFCGHILQCLGKQIDEHAQRARQRQQLLEMDDRLLRDIGLNRADAVYLAANLHSHRKPLPNEEPHEHPHYAHQN